MLQSRFIKPNATQQAHTVDRPVRITNFHEKIDESNDKPVLTSGQQSRVQYSTRPIPFEHVKGIVEKIYHIYYHHCMRLRLKLA